MKTKITTAKSATLRSRSRGAARNAAFTRQRLASCSPLPPEGGVPALVRLTPRTPHPAPALAFTLLEVLLALMILAMVLGVVHSIFHGAVQLRNKTDQAFEDAIPLQHALSLIKRDLANLTIPGGTLTGTLQTSPTTTSTTSASHSGQQAGPIFYTASATVSDNSVMSEMQKVTYYLMPATNGGNGLDLVRSVSRNLLPTITEEFSDQRLLGSVQSLTFQFYNGTAWADTWDSTAISSTTGTTNNLPQGIRVQLTLAAESGQFAQEPIQLVVPVTVQASTNSTTSGGGS